MALPLGLAPALRPGFTVARREKSWAWTWSVKAVLCIQTSDIFSVFPTDISSSYLFVSYTTTKERTRSSGRYVKKNQTSWGISKEGSVRDDWAAIPSSLQACWCCHFSWRTFSQWPASVLRSAGQWPLEVNKLSMQLRSVNKGLFTFFSHSLSIFIDKK